ncbi:hypothetical protein HYR99_03595 [Candidatus Poribacteria bacterium]|nr:hypothetical protein [Candidatus Poribacteria bacterium]
MLNFILKIGMFGLVLVMLWHNGRIYWEERKPDARHLLLWALSLLFVTLIGLLGEVAIRAKRMTPLLHVSYDAFGNGFLLLAIYQISAFTVELTQHGRKGVEKRFIGLVLGVGWLIMMGFYIPYRYQQGELFFFAYNGVRFGVFFWCVGRAMFWFHRQARSTVEFLTRHQMHLLKWSAFFCLLYPLAVLPHPEHYSPRPNLIVAFCSVSLFFLGNVMPQWFQWLLYLVAASPGERRLSRYLSLLGQISDFFNPMPTDRFLLERWIRQFGEYLGLPAGQISLIVRTSYLFEVGRLRDQSTAADERTPAERVTQSADFVEEALGYEDIALVLRHVGERWDGRGYPDGLSRWEIPFESRVLALMKAFVGEFYLSEDVNAALEVVKAEEGAFDPNLVAALEEMISRFR